MYNTELRLSWDKSLKIMEKLESGEYSYVISSWMHSPMFMVAERDVIDKRVEFFYENNYYCISSSVPEEVRFILFLVRNY